MLRRIIAEFWSALSNAAAASEGALVISPMETGSQHLQRAPRASRCLCGNRRKGEIPPPARPRAVPGNSAGRDPRPELGSSAVVPARGVPRSPGSGTELEPVKQLYLGVPEIRPRRAGLGKCFRKRAATFSKEPGCQNSLLKISPGIPSICLFSHFEGWWLNPYLQCDSPTHGEQWELCHHH